MAHFTNSFLVRFMCYRRSGTSFKYVPNFISPLIIINDIMIISLTASCTSLSVALDEDVTEKQPESSTRTAPQGFHKISTQPHQALSPLCCAPPTNSTAS